MFSSLWNPWHRRLFYNREHVVEYALYKISAHTVHENINKLLNIYKSFYSRKAGGAESCQQNRGCFFFSLSALSREDCTRFFWRPWFSGKPGPRALAGLQFSAGGSGRAKPASVWDVVHHQKMDWICYIAERQNWGKNVTISFPKQSCFFFVDLSCLF